MKTSFNYRNVELREPVEEEVTRNLTKIQRLLSTYSPDLVQIHGAFEKHPRKVEYSFSLNLSLPTGNLHATSASPDVRLSVKEAFADLASQLKRHQSRLRKDYEWKRKRPRAEGMAKRS
jgi:ribosomal subunit interface protein